MAFNEILLGKSEGVAVITLNRPERFNSFTRSMYREFPRILDQLRRDDEVKAVILTGSGKGFCAGSDVSDRLGKPGKGISPFPGAIKGVQHIALYHRAIKKT